MKEADGGLIDHAEPFSQAILVNTCNAGVAIADRREAQEKGARRAIQGVSRAPHDQENSWIAQQNPAVRLRPVGAGERGAVTREKR